MKSIFWSGVGITTHKFFLSSLYCLYIYVKGVSLPFDNHCPVQTTECISFIFSHLFEMLLWDSVNLFGMTVWEISCIWLSLMFVDGNLLVIVFESMRFFWIDFVLAILVLPMALLFKGNRTLNVTIVMFLWLFFIFLLSVHFWNNIVPAFITNMVIIWLCVPFWESLLSEPLLICSQFCHFSVQLVCCTNCSWPFSFCALRLIFLGCHMSLRCRDAR